MSAQRQPAPGEADPRAVFAFLAEWADQFHDDSSPARVTDVLVVFAFLIGLNFAAKSPTLHAALLRRLEEEMPSASQCSRLLAQAMADSMTESHWQEAKPRRSAYGPSAP